MNRKSVTVILGGAVIGIMIMLAIYMGLIVTGVIDTRPSELVIVANSAEKEYDGQPLECHEYTIKSGELRLGHSIEASFDTSLTGVGSCENVMHIKIVDTRGADVTDHYRLETRSGTLTVAPCKLVVKSGDAKQAYNGTPLVNHDWSIVTGKLPEGIRAKAEFSGSQEEPGSSKNNFVLALTDEKGVSVDRNFTITYMPGKLEVTKHAIVVRSDSAAKIYDGEPLVKDTYTMTGDLAPGHDLRVDFPISQTDVGSATNSISVRIYAGNRDVTSYYDVKVSFGSLTVQPKAIEISVMTNIIRNFYGDVLPEGTAELTRGQLAPGHELETYVEAAPNIHNTVEFFIRSATITDSYGRNVTSNYSISLVHAVDKELQTDLVLSSSSKSDVYTGDPLTCEEYTIKSGELESGHFIETYFTGSQTEIGFSDNTFTVAIIDRTTGDDVTYRYNISYEYGTLEVYESRPLTGGEIQDDGSLNGSSVQDQEATAAHIWAESAGKVYLRWKSKGNYGFVAEVNDWRWSDAMAYPLSDTNMLFTVGQTLDADGKIPVLYEIEIAGSQFLLPNYVAEGPEGARNDTVLSPSETQYTLYGYQWTYNVYDASAYALLGIEDEQMKAYTAFVMAQYTSVPESTKQVLLELAEQNGIKADRPTIIEDVEAYIRSCAEYDMEFPACPEGQDSVVHFLTESQKGVCRHFASAATLMYRALGIPARYVEGYSVYAQADEWTEVKGKDAHAWVEVFIPGFGWIRVDPTPAASSSSGGSADGETLVLDLYEMQPFYTGFKPEIDVERAVGYRGLKDGHEIVFGTDAIINNARAEAGDYNYTVDLDKVRVQDSDGNDVTSEYNIVIGNEGVIKVRKITLTITSPSAKKQYDGQPLTANKCSYQFAGDPMLKDVYPFVYTASFSGASGVLTEVGTIKNVITRDVVITDAFGSDVTQNFEIVYKEGELKVYMYELTITTGGASKTYDGIPLQNTYIEYDASALAARGHELVYTMPSLTDAGSISNTPSYTIMGQDGKPVDKNLYDVRFDVGTLTVSPVKLTILTKSASKTYDGTALRVDGYEIQAGSLVSGQDIVSYKMNGSQTNVGSSEVWVTAIRIQNADGQNVTRNYQITIKPGTLTVLAP